MPNTDRALPDWPRAHGEPLLEGRIRTDPADFDVTEVLGWEPSGDGEHDLLQVEKTGQNTGWVARALAKYAGIPSRDVGYSGQKDRHAITRQWFSVRRPARRTPDWSALDIEGVRVLEAGRHRRKLKRGSHRQNRFRILVRSDRFDPVRVAARLAEIADAGVPNYFGPQRFGRDGGNLGLARELFDGLRLDRPQRSIAISAARSLLFNDVLAERIRRECWDRGLGGDCFNLDGTGSVFVEDVVDEALQSRVSALDVHPTGPLWGRGEPPCRGEARALERAIVEAADGWAEGLVAIGASMARRSLRVRASDLQWDADGPGLAVSFSLPRGAYATSVLREFAEIGDG